MKSLHVTRKIERPGLPLLLVSGLLFWLGVVLCLPFAFSLSREALTIGALGFFVLALGGIFACLVGKKGWAIYLLIIVLSVVCTFSFALTLITDRETQASSLSGVFTFYLTEDVRHTEYSHTVLAQTALQTGRQVTVRLFVPEDASLAFGSTIKAHTDLRLPSETSMQLCNTKGAAFVATIDSYELVKNNSPLSALGDLRAHFLEMFVPQEVQRALPDGALLIQAIMFGDRSALLTSDVYELMQKAGLAHLVAVSGAHLVIVSACIAFILRKLALPQVFKIGIQISALLIYLILVGLPLSCLRAAVMAILGLLALFARRRSSALSALGVAIMIFIASDPTCATSLSFALSCLATLGILLFVPLLKPWLTFLATRLLHRSLSGALIDPLSMTLAATLLTIPISITTFAQFPLIAPLSNIIATPVLTLICSLGVVGVLLSWIPGTAFLIGLCMSALAEAFAAIVRMIHLIPYSCIPCDGDALVVGIVVFLVCAFLWVLWPKPAVLTKLIAVLAVVLAVVFATQAIIYKPAPGILMLDVGQGDAIVIRSAYHQILIDTGNQSTRLKKALARNNLTHFDAVVITHADDDHCGCLAELADMVTIDTVVLAKDLPQVKDDSSIKLLNDAEQAVSAITYVSVGDTIHFDEFALMVVSPQTFSDSGGNADSICLFVTYDADGDGVVEWTSLLTGDAENEVIDDILALNPSLTSDVLKVAHHGSKAALSEETLSKLNPKIALISVGENNRYGHPHRTTVSLLEKHGVVIGRTDEQGDVMVEFSKDALTLDTQR